jgi:hypothetical protein
MKVNISVPAHTQVVDVSHSRHLLVGHRMNELQETVLLQPSLGLGIGPGREYHHFIAPGNHLAQELQGPGHRIIEMIRTLPAIASVQHAIQVHRYRLS